MSNFGRPPGQIYTKPIPYISPFLSPLALSQRSKGLLVRDKNRMDENDEGIDG